MRVTIAAVGRDRKSIHRDLYEHYAERLRWPVALREVEARGRKTGGALRLEEAERLLAAVPDGATIIALDETGKTLTSRAFAAWISRGLDEGIGELALVIGGADGLEPSPPDAFPRATDLAASAGPRPGGGAALSRATDHRRSPLSPGLIVPSPENPL
jgi:23S rRNA (pseudouridine1915-N3)-methyltransferase